MAYFQLLDLWHSFAVVQVLYPFLMDEPQIQILPSSHPQFTLLYRSAVPFLPISQSHSSPSISFVLPHSFSFPPSFSSISPYAFSVPPSQWLCGVLHLCYVMALRGRLHFNQYFKQPGPWGLAPNATWQHERMTFEEGGERRPRKNLLLPAVLRLKGGGYDWEEKTEREHWWERLETTGERKKFQGKEEQQADKKHTHLGTQAQGDSYV